MYFDINSNPIDLNNYNGIVFDQSGNSIGVSDGSGRLLNSNGDPVALTTEPTNPQIPPSGGQGSSASNIFGTIAQFGTVLASLITQRPVAVNQYGQPIGIGKPGYGSGYGVGVYQPGTTVSGSSMTLLLIGGLVLVGVVLLSKK